MGGGAGGQGGEFTGRYSLGVFVPVNSSLSVKMGTASHLLLLLILKICFGELLHGKDI